MLSPEDQRWLVKQFEKAIVEGKPTSISLHSGAVFTLTFRSGKVSIGKALPTEPESPAVIQPLPLEI